MIEIGTTIKITANPPNCDLRIGDTGVIKAIYSYYYNVVMTKDNVEYRIPKNCIAEYKFKSGDRIRVVSSLSKYKGYLGTVYGSVSKCVHLFIDGTQYKPGYDNGVNNRYLTLKSTSVQLINNQNESEEKVMSKLTGYKKVAGIKMGLVTYYFALYDENINVGDTVLVSGTCKEAVVVSEILTTEEAKEKTTKTITAEVKCKVDLSAYETRVQNRIKAEELKKKMDQKIAEMDEMNKYVYYAEKNPELANMLAEYQDLI